MRQLLASTSLLFAASLAGCLIDRGAIGGGGEDAAIDPSIDARVVIDAAPEPDANLDAWLDPTIDAFRPDAFMEPPDAWAPDAWTADDAWAPTDAWRAPDAWAPDAAVCTPRCEGNVLVGCDGTRTTCVACGSSTSLDAPHCLTLVPSNTGSVDLMARADDVNITSVVEWNTTDCDSGGLSGVAREIAHEIRLEGVDLCVVLTRSFTVSGELRATGDRALVIVASERIEITASGILTVASHNDESTLTCSRRPGGAGARTGGAGVGGNGVAGDHDYIPDSGGGGGGHCGLGGSGGDGGGGAVGGGGGGIVGPDDMVPLQGGSAGGNGNGRVGEGGRGGGAVQLSAPRVIVNGRILAHGAGGLGGDNETGGRRQAAGGGGGSGGAIHLEALELTLAGGSMLDLRGGGGGAGACWNGSAQIGHCGVASTAPAATSGTAASCAGVGAGGDGASLSSANGEAGDDAYEGHGGGGGAGCALLRSYLGTPSAVTAPNVGSILSRMPPNVR